MHVHVRVRPALTKLQKAVKDPKVRDSGNECCSPARESRLLIVTQHVITQQCGQLCAAASSSPQEVRGSGRSLKEEDVSRATSIINSLKKDFFTVMFE